MKSFIVSFFIILFGNLATAQTEKTPFLPDIVKQFPNVRDIAISPNTKEIMFTAQSVMGNLSAIITVKKNGDLWSTPKIVSFSGQYFDLEPCFSKDGLKLYFVSTRPKSSLKKNTKDFDIWVVSRKTMDDTWSSPQNMGAPINSEHGEFYPSIADNGNLYFTRDNPELNQKDDIYVSKLSGNTYLEPSVLPNAINSEGYEYNAFIAPDESYIIFGAYKRKDGYGSGDLYISYNAKGNWTEAKNLGNTINSEKMDYCPFVDTKRKMLIYTSKIDNTKTEFNQPLTTSDFLQELQKYDNGSSRLYQISIEEFIKK